MTKKTLTTKILLTVLVLVLWAAIVTMPSRLWQLIATVIAMVMAILFSSWWRSRRQS